MPRSRPWLTASAVLALAYIGYTVWSKYAAFLGPPPVKLDDVGEFLLFLAAIVAFTMQIFAEDRGEADGDDHV